MTIQFAKLSANNTVTGTTITDDPTLQLALEASTRYRVIELNEWHANDTVDWKRKMYYTNGGSVTLGPFGYGLIRNAVAALTTSVNQSPPVTASFLNDEYEQNGSNTSSHRGFALVDSQVTTNAAGDLRIARSPRFAGAANLTTYAGSSLIAIPEADFAFDPDRGDLVAYKSGDQTIAADAANTTITDFALALEADRDYLLEILINVKADAGNVNVAGYGLYWGYSGSVATALLIGRMTDMLAFDNSMASADSKGWLWSNASSSLGTARTVDSGAASTYSIAKVVGVVRGSTAGDFTAVIDPAGSAGDDIIVGAGSCMVATALN